MVKWAYYFKYVVKFTALYVVKVNKNVCAGLPGNKLTSRSSFKLDIQQNCPISVVFDDVYVSIYREIICICKCSLFYFNIQLLLP